MNLSEARGMRCSVRDSFTVLVDAFGSNNIFDAERNLLWELATALGRKEQSNEGEVLEERRKKADFMVDPRVPEVSDL